MIINSYSENLFFAHSALSRIQKDFSVGSTNRPGDSDRPQFQQASDRIEAACDYWQKKIDATVFSMAPTDPHFEEYFILDAMLFGGSHGIQEAGNCGAKSCAALGYLFLCNIKPVAYASVTSGGSEGGHDFLIIGDLNKPNEAIVCDLHYEECYQLARFKDYSAAKYFGTDIEIQWQCTKEYDEQSIEKLCGRPPILIDQPQERVSRFFFSKFTEYLKASRVIFNLGQNNLTLDPPTIKFSAKPRKFVVPTEEMQRVSQFEEVSARAQEYQKGVRVR
ncbi:MAG: hypothetical protein P4M14_01035 [Gammaproteobacteria bacterium]|nr:hypothetical protein [Gammaproteobacteria bacterium]